MNFRHWLVCGTIFFSLSTNAQASQTPAPTPLKPSTAEEWRLLTLSDLAAVEKILRAHTPIPFDRESPGLLTWLEAGYANARERAAGVQNEAGWYYTLAAFANGFRDPHLSVSPVTALPPARWPGFIAAARKDGAVVITRDAQNADDNSVPELGSEVLRCDDLSLMALAATRIFPFLYNPDIPADQRRAVTRLFLDRQIPFAPPPAQCLVRTKGVERNITLKWRPLPQENGRDSAAWFTQFQNASMGQATNWGVSEPASGVTWIGVPTFSSGEETAPKLEALIEAVKQRGDTMRNGRAIVIDTRGNGGGNSAWATKLVEAIFTRDIVQKYRPKTSASGTDWRASAGNIAYWQEWEQKMAAESGAFSGSRLYAQHVVQRMTDALAEGNPLYREGSANTGQSGGLTRKRPKGASPFPARVYFLSNGSCGSSCLNFADAVLHVPGVKLIGSATAGDGMLMDVRSEALPSGMATITFPQKVARGRARGNLEFYFADIAYDGTWEDAAVREWVMQRVAADATSRGDAVK